MALYGHEVLREEDFSHEIDMDALVEMYFIDDISRMSSKQIKEFCESEQAKALQEKAVLTKPTMMRLSKQDDETRRIKLACYQLAKEANDPLWNKFKLLTAKRKEIIAKIMKKYGNKGGKQAVKAQKAYIKLSSKLPAKASDNLR
jgi:hypothetical protein